MKKLRSYIKIITVVSAITALTACKKQLDLKPHDQIDATDAITTDKDVQSNLIGAYNRAGLSYIYGGDVFLMPDLMASQSVVKWSGTFQDLTEMVNQRVTINNGYVDNYWLDAYRVNNQANYVLANLDKATAANKNSYEGQAKFLRGLMYFDMARLFGKSWNDGDPNVNLAVPIVLKPTTVIGTDSYPSRSTVAQVYAQAIADLTDAETKLTTSTSFYANTYAASAILARIYLQQGQYAKAVTEATKVISSGAYSLVANYADEFPFPNQNAVHVDNTTEDIFAIQVTAQQGVNDLNTFYASSDYAGRGDISVRSTFLDEFEEGDGRLAVYNEDSGGSLQVDKFDNLYGNVRVIRLAELYLIRAEANFRLGTSTGATPVEDINVIRARAGLTALTSVTLDQILKERRLELAFEGGFFLHDAKRLKQNVGALPYTSPRLVFPIPLLEINANKNLKQNDGY
ncbi:RagB/SusD domain-containing protein [Mucilaginibacter sp. OK268]|uniref:RagB/SusD family nutrient uptake outer membrane protein n=1 Tax=Mucilaginibacter sp. OK268 TaxID=1881048 RepID=UPI000881C62F|nr:RagB/SusD family nutrient uptake outer membrane protein [Mucilaginibacter sp. OK268]SDQ01334.1 RagB/SusD domain-containing protein [Mucilaginibacter sp. OK268]